MAITWNDVHADINVSGGGLTVYNANASAGFRAGRASAPLAGKCVWGYRFTTGGTETGGAAARIGVLLPGTSLQTGNPEEENPGFCLNSDPSYFVNGVYVNSWSPGFAIDRVIVFAVDTASGKFWYGWGDASTPFSWTGNPAAGTGEAGAFTTGSTLYPAFSVPPEIDGGAVITGLFTEAAISALVSGGYSHPSGFDDIPEGTLPPVPLDIVQTVASVVPEQQLSITQRVAIKRAAVGLQISQQVSTPAVSLLAITQTVAALRGVEELSITQAVAFEPGAQLKIAQTVAAPVGAQQLEIEQTVVDLSLLPSGVDVWSDRVMLNGVNVSADVLGVTSIEQEENGAMVADFVLKPAAGPINVNAWTNARVRIYWRAHDLAGTLIGEWLVFSGKVQIVDPDVATMTIRFRCSDQFQEAINRMSNAQIDSITAGARWHREVFRRSEPSRGWDYLLERMATLEASIHQDPHGSIIVTPWEAKATADHVFTSADWIDRTPRLELVHLRNLRNKTTIRMQYRYTRQWQRKRTVGWHAQTTLCDYLYNPHTLPDRDMCIRAAEGIGGWMVDSIGFIPLWERGEYRCSGKTINFINNAPDLVLGTRAIVKRRWSQFLTQEIDITLECPSSIAAYGEIPAEAVYSLETDFDVESWEGAEGNNKNSAAALSVQAASNAQDGSTGVFALGNIETYPPPDGAIVGSSGDHYFDNVDLDDFEAFALCALAREKAEMTATHRENNLVLDIPFNPFISLSDTIEVDGGGVEAKGKVRHWRAVFDRRRGSARMTIRIAISRPGGSGSSDTLIAPLLVAFDPPPPETPSALSGGAGTQLGGRVDSPDYDEDKEGYSGNYNALAVTVIGANVGDDGRTYAIEGVIDNSRPENAKVYPERLRYKLDEIPVAQRQATALVSSVAFIVAPPNDPLTLTAT